MVEIYNEVIYDLLDPTTPVCALREDMKQRGGGIFVDGNVEELITCPEDALGVSRFHDDCFEGIRKQAYADAHGGAERRFWRLAVAIVMLLPLR